MNTTHHNDAKRASSPRLGKRLWLAPAAAMALMFSALFMACGKSDSGDVGHIFANSVFVHKGDVFVAGALVTNTELPIPFWTAVLWKNGRIIYKLDSGKEHPESHAMSVFVTDTDVYMAGMDGNKAVLWKNGEAQQLAGDYQNVIANSLFVSGDDVYVAGFSTDEPYYISTALLWKNGEAQYLDLADDRQSSAKSVFVSGGDVYVAGNDDGKAALWKNGARQNLDLIDAFRSGAGSVFVSAGDVYVAGAESDGNENHTAVLWKNGNKQDIGSALHSSASSVFVSEGNVYVGGCTGLIDYPSVWKNGAAQQLARGNGEVNSLFVSNGDVYVVGKIQSDAIIWKNGAGQKLPRK
jgi:WD40 repeat protein